MAAKRTGKRVSAKPDDELGLIKSMICDWLAQGKSLAGYCRETCTSYSAVMEWLKADPEFQDNYARAREESGHADADAVTDIKERMLKGEITPEMARVAIDAAKWSAGKRQPKKYGDKLDLNTTIAGEIKIVVGGDIQ